MPLLSSLADAPRWLRLLAIVVLATLKKAQPDYADWMITVAYRAA